MNEQVTQADTLLTQVEAFLAAHPVAKWLALAWLFGWAIAFVLRIVVKRSPWSEDTERVVVLISCILFSGLAAGRMWYGQEYLIIVSTIMGVTSPFAYLALAELVCKFRPSLKPYLSLRKDFSAVVSDGLSDEPAVPPSTQDVKP